ncbi:hypothetical protein ScPMuIL_001628 [Solemya velum]
MTGTVVPADDFQSDERATELKDAMDGLGTNEGVIIDIIDRHSNEQRCEIAVAYKQAYGEDLIDDLKSELGGNFEDTVVALMTPPRLYDVRELRKAVSGCGTDDTALIEIMCSRSNEELEGIKAMYKEEYETELEEDLDSDTSGYFGRMMISLCTGGRETNQYVDSDQAEEDANQLYEAGAGSLGTEESAINKVLCLRSFPQLRAIFQIYEAKCEHSIEQAIDDETSANLKAGYLAIVRYAKDPISFFAKRINDAISGIGTSDSDLIRLIVSRSEIDLADICSCYENEYGKSLSDAISDDCSGDYKRMLLRLIS